ncbi:hypothetical protein [Haloquadratum walsbyi]|nr:hypothetical protein [Haloquadratum walsbyi]
MLEDHARIINVFVTARRALGQDVNELTNNPMSMATPIADTAID